MLGASRRCRCRTPSQVETPSQAKTPSQIKTPNRNKTSNNFPPLAHTRRIHVSDVPFFCDNGINRHSTDLRPDTTLPEQSRAGYRRRPPFSLPFVLFFHRVS